MASSLRRLSSRGAAFFCEGAFALYSEKFVAVNRASLAGVSFLFLPGTLKLSLEDRLLNDRSNNIRHGQKFLSSYFLELRADAAG
jgi:hypothetical protein